MEENVYKNLLGWRIKQTEADKPCNYSELNHVRQRIANHDKEIITFIKMEDYY